MKRAASLLSSGVAGLLLSIWGVGACNADDTAPKVQYFTAVQLASQAAHLVDGVAAKQFMNVPGGNVYIVHRDKNGEAEVHMALNDIFIVKSGHAKITVGGQITGNRETAPTEWRGGEITGGTDYPLAPGDVLFIPAGMPHKVLVSAKASITYVTVKTPK
jgi:mannose-6-phosphate isomerase-like protein (cupin superfamily)